METTVTALQMRKKFGGILDRVAKRGDHVTILRGNRPVAVLVPAKEHEEQCLSKDRFKRREEVLNELLEWRRENRDKIKSLPGEDSVTLIRRMRDSR
jgi:prevent-host-death family protein